MFININIEESAKMLDTCLTPHLIDICSLILKTGYFNCNFIVYVETELLIQSAEELFSPTLSTTVYSYQLCQIHSFNL